MRFSSLKMLLLIKTLYIKFFCSVFSLEFWSKNCFNFTGKLDYLFEYFLHILQIKKTNCQAKIQNLNSDFDRILKKQRLFILTDKVRLHSSLLHTNSTTYCSSILFLFGGEEGYWCIFIQQVTIEDCNFLKFLWVVSFAKIKYAI
jgi:hypothetical protein